MKEVAQLRKFIAANKNNLNIKGHCRIDYTDPITGRVLERIEGNNHVFVDQFIAQNWQDQVLRSSLVITNGKKSLDTDLPWIPGKPIGYGNAGSSASGVYRGAYRSTDSYRGRVSPSSVDSLFVYDFLTTQITDDIGYVGLSAQGNVGATTLPFYYRYTRASAAGIYDIERKMLFHDFTCSLSNVSGGSGSLGFYSLYNEPTESSVYHDVFELCGSPDVYRSDAMYSYGAQSYWGYDYENQQVVLLLIRYNSNRYYNNDHYELNWYYKTDVWVFNKDASEVKTHYQYTDEQLATTSYDWYYVYITFIRALRIGGTFVGYFRLYGEKLYAMSINDNTSSGASDMHSWYMYNMDIGTGEVTCTEYECGTVETNGETCIIADSQTLYCYKGYMFSSAYPYSNQAHSYVSYGLDSDTVVGVNPMYDVYTDDVYTYNPASSNNSWCELIEKGQTSIYGSTWNFKGYTETADATAWPYTRFAYTAYKLPSDAPTRPANSAVTIAYGLTINW